MMARIWSGQNKIYWLLVPFSLLYGVIVFIRKWLYRLKIFRSWNASLPVIIVGNLSVGGNGKTPVVIYLIEQLIAKGYHVGVVSRGYGGKSDHYPIIVNSDTPASIVGDEPFLIYQRTQVPFAVSPKRCDAVKALINQFALDVIIADDGLQHYALKRDIEIVVIDGKRGFGNGHYLPAGPMRELPSRLNSVDFTIINGYSSLSYPNAYPMTLQPFNAINLRTKQQKPISELSKICAIAGIGDPNRFFSMLEEYNADTIKTVGFPDHHHYTKEQLSSLISTNETLLMTEKDAVKCLHFADYNWWYVPIIANLPDELINNLLKKLVIH